MAKQMVKCIYCKMTLDKQEAVQPNPDIFRYAHKDCYERIQASKTQAEKDYEELENYIKKLFNIQILTATITKQIKTFKEDYDLSYTGILKTLQWWYEIKKNKIEDKNWGIAIVPHIYAQAEDYYRSIWTAEQANAAMDLEHYQPKVEIVRIPPPRPMRQPPQLFDLEEKENK